MTPETITESRVADLLVSLQLATAGIAEMLREIRDNEITPEDACQVIAEIRANINTACQ